MRSKGAAKGLPRAVPLRSAKKLRAEKDKVEPGAVEAGRSNSHIGRASAHTRRRRRVAEEGSKVKTMSVELKGAREGEDDGGHAHDVLRGPDGALAEPLPAERASRNMALRLCGGMFRPPPRSAGRPS